MLRIFARLTAPEERERHSRLEARAGFYGERGPRLRNEDHAAVWLGEPGRALPPPGGARALPPAARGARARPRPARAPRAPRRRLARRARPARAAPWRGTLLAAGRRAAASPR